MSPKSRKTPASREAVDRLLRENLFLFFRARAAGERLFSRLGQTPGKVSLMRSVYEEGPQSVAQIARARPVARQGVQRMTDQLAAEGLVEFADNPAHRRAKLVHLTAAGRKLLEKIEGGAALWPAELVRQFDRQEVETALAVTRKLIEMMARLEASAGSKGGGAGHRGRGSRGRKGSSRPARGAV